MNMPTERYQHLLIWLLALTLAVSAVFTAFPQLDIYVSGLFYDGGFWLHDIGFPEAVRQVLYKGMVLFALGILLAFLIALGRRRPLKALGYAVTVILLGPLLLVNGILKTYWGRARPQDVLEFGGDRLFTPAYQMSDQCDVNCSFTSGEGGSIAVAAFLILFLAWPKLARRGRAWLSAAMALMVLVGAGLRVVTGQHFLSDTLLSILFCALVAAGLYRLFYPDKTTRYSVSSLPAKAAHKGLGFEIDLLVPAVAQHRPAVKAFLDGKYYEAFSHRAFKKILRHRPGNAVHAGAFFGDMLHTLSHYADTVYAFEPVLDNYILAKNNIAHLELENVVLQNAGLGAKSGFATMQTRTPEGQFRGGASSIVTRKNIAPEALERVPLFALDDLPIDTLSLLHLDVEGYEVEVLEGAKRLIAHSGPIILLEDNKENCRALLEALGYRHIFHHSGLHYWALPDDAEFVSSLKPA